MNVRGALCAATLLLALTAPSAAQPVDNANGLLLVAKPGMADPNFARAVVLVTQAEDASTVGVILNRPSRAKLTQLLPEEPASANYRDAVYAGGPVMRRALIALFRSDDKPPAAAFHVLKGVYLSMHPENLKALLADASRSYRIYAGFSGWAPRQLESEFVRNDWYVLPADAETVFRANTEGLWEELVRKATQPRPQT